MMQFLTGAPIWVWPLLVVLVIIGLRSRKARKVPALMVYTLPLLGMMALRTTGMLPAGGWIWGVFALAYLVGAFAGHRLQGRWIIGREGRFVHLSGESLTLSVMMLVFWANFVGGTLQAVAPEIYASVGFLAGFVAAVAIATGTFAGRALRVWQLA